jgi:uncharacterized protein YbbK (DUF523 family)
MRYVLVSACLLGVNCRYNGVEKADERVLRLIRENTATATAGESSPEASEPPEADTLSLIPVCPEQLGGLPTPRDPSECRGGHVFTSAGADVTTQYRRGAEEALKLAELYHCDTAILKERSPSCSPARIYDGTFTATLIEGQGVTARLLRQHGIRVIGESELDKL